MSYKPPGTDLDYYTGKFEDEKLAKGVNLNEDMILELEDVASRLGAEENEHLVKSYVFIKMAVGTWAKKAGPVTCLITSNKVEDIEDRREGIQVEHQENWIDGDDFDEAAEEYEAYEEDVDDYDDEDYEVDPEDIVEKPEVQICKAEGKIEGHEDKIEEHEVKGQEPDDTELDFEDFKVRMAKLLSPVPVVADKKPNLDLIPTPPGGNRKVYKKIDLLEIGHACLRAEIGKFKVVKRQLTYEAEQARANDGGGGGGGGGRRRVV